MKEDDVNESEVWKQRFISILKLAQRERGDDKRRDEVSTQRHWL